MALETLFNVIRDGLRWPGYDRSLEIATQAKEIFSETTDGQQATIEAIRTSETREQLQTRLRITHPLTGAALAGPISYQEKVRRAPDRVPAFMHEDQKASENISKAFETFYGREDLYGYVFDYSRRCQNFDPNAWLLLEQRREDGRLYPVEVSSEEAIWHEVDEVGDLLSFCFMRQETTPDGHPFRRWYLYTKDEAVEAVEVTPKAPAPEGWAQALLQGRAGKVTVAYMEYPGLDLPAVPAMKMGAYADVQERGVYELFYQRAVPVLRYLMVAGNTMQVTELAHGFPIRYRYVKECTDQNEQGEVCTGGYYGGGMDSESRCKACRGTGVIVPRSELDEVHMVLPAGVAPSELIDLAKLQHDQRPPVEGIAYIDAKVERLMRLITALVFNQDPTSRVEMATATAVTAAVDSITNHLLPLAEAIENVWEQCHVLAMGYAGLDPAKGDASLQHPSDFGIEPLESVLTEYKTAKDAGLPATMLDPLVRRAFNRLYRNDPRRVEDAMAYEEWRPWRAKPDAVAAMLAAQLDPLDTTRLLWEHFDRVVEEARALIPEGNSFYEYQRPAQWAFIQAAVKLVADTLTLAQPAPAPDGFPMLEPEDSGEEE
jgi:hypothetical protein